MIGFVELIEFIGLIGLIEFIGLMELKGHPPLILPIKGGKSPASLSVDGGENNLLSLEGRG